MSTSKNIGKNFFWLFIGDVASKGLLFITTIWIARKLTDEGFGKLAFAQAILSYSLLAIDLGLSIFGTREIARFKTKAAAFVADIVAIRFLLALILFAASVIILHIIEIDLELKFLIGFSLIFLFPSALNIEYAFQGLEKMQYASLSQTLFQLFYLISVLLFIHKLTDLLKVPLFRAGSALLASLILLICFYYKYGGINLFKHIQPRRWFSYIRASIVMVASLFVIKIYTSFDILMLGIYKPPEVVGWYNAAFKMMAMFVTFAGLLQTTFAPFFAREIGNRAVFMKGIKNFSLVLILSGALISGILIVSSKYIVPLLLGTDYLPSITILIYLSVSLLFIFADTIYLGPLLFTGYQKYYFYSTTIGAVINIVLNLILIPRYSYHGAAIATIVCNASVFIFGAIYFYKIFSFDWETFKILIFGFGGWGLFILLFNQLLYISILVGTLTFLLLILLITWYWRKPLLNLIQGIK